MARPDDAQQAPGTGSPARGAVLGRRIALGLWFVAVTWVIGSAFWWVPAQIFASAADPSATAEPRVCPDGLARLEAELFDDALSTLDPRDGRPVPDPRWWRAWDAEHASLAASCGGPLADAHADLGKLRHRIQTLLERHDRGTGALARSIHEAIRATSYPDGSAPPENDFP